jgi:hypothetical protein
MKIWDRLTNRRPRGEAGHPGSPQASSADEQQLPIARYDELDAKQVIPQLSHLSQVELAAVEAHERSHRNRPVVLNRLRWLRGSEPLPGYDALDSDQIAAALADADAATVKAVRSYERHHRNRQDVRAEVTRVIPTARASAGEKRARKQKEALVQAGIRSDPPAPVADGDGPPALKAGSRRSRVDRVDPAREERNERERLAEEARYRRERLELYRARLYGGRAVSQGRLRELERASDGAAERLRRAEAARAKAGSPARGDGDRRGAADPRRPPAAPARSPASSRGTRSAAGTA